MCGHTAYRYSGDSQTVAKTSIQRAISASLSLQEARALALRAQGFGASILVEPFDVLDHLRVIQLDSVNVVARSHELIPAARLGPTSVESIRQAIYVDRRGFEYWGHAASWLLMEDYRYFLPRMTRMAERWKAAGEQHAHLESEIIARIRSEGPLGAADFDAPPRTKQNGWWSWKPAKIVLEHLFARGDLMCSGRTNGFARLYDLPERVLPPGLDRSTPSTGEADRYLLRKSIAALGVATALDASDYFRLPGSRWRESLRELVENGEVVEVAVDGWSAPAYVVPTVLEATPTLPDHRPTLLSPFDNLIWDRDRDERLFGFHYRIEIYVPADKRQHGYYVLPLLARGRLLGRVDVKFDRAASVLIARAIWLEGASPEEATSAVRDLAAHIGASTIKVDRVMLESTRADVKVS
jgi:uncharacterized protein YcaQ